jgi:hypothetical protein
MDASGMTMSHFATSFDAEKWDILMIPTEGEA